MKVVFARVTVVLLFAVHGATYLTLRTFGDLRERAAIAAARLSVPAAVLGIVFVAWTVAVAHDHSARGILPTVIPAVVAAIALIAATALASARRSMSAPAMTGRAAIGIVATIFTGLYPRVLVSSPTLRQQPHDLERRSRPLRTRCDHDHRGHLHSIVLLYQSWADYAFRNRLGGTEPQAPAAARRRETANRV